MTDTGASEVWWSPQEAALATKFHEETLRRWARSEPPRVRSKEATVGKQRRLLLHQGDVLAEATKSAPRGSRRHVITAPAYQPSGPTTEAALRDRVSTLEEVLRRHRVIDEQRQDIERSHTEIIRQLQEVEGLLLGPSWVPND